ncbi:OmpA family protein [Pseudooceanicola nitratireducens]|jgi:outer membrane protein OmpA-like peptidoglycan-associated protein|uniref:OmpA family protein n=1 Tax=Pseudooceanicola nitratireducens TaxID=517719 RepID=A0A1I1MJV6_9RHOB|nr:OmpA family protein [Pseudooceanicola nitratireducens]SEI85255.1 OmpA family protein [Pseudooceanicola nitratireducens]SFC85697.1 OmpA family protein [Pseudooceanicola nitratireducens]
MNSKFLKSTTAIVLSLSLAVPHVALAQTAAELEAELGVDTSNLTEAELEDLRKQLADQRAAQAADAPSAQTEAPANTQAEASANAPADAPADSAATAEAPVAEPAEEPGLLDRAVGAVTEQLNAVTGNDTSAEAAPEASAEAPADTVTPEATAETTTEETATEAPAATAAETTAETTAETAPTAEPAAEPAEEQTAETPAETTETAPEATAQADGSVATEESSEPQGTMLEQTVDKLRAQVEELTTNTEDLAERQAASEAAAAEAQAGSMAAQAEGTEGAEVVESTVTEETARSSTEEFQTDVASTEGATDAEATATSEKKGLDTAGKIALLGLGALAVGQILKNGSEVVSNSGDRVVVQQADGTYKVLKNDDAVMFQPGTDVKTFAYDDGSTRTVAVRQDGTQIETIRAADGTVLRRARIFEDGTRVVLFDDTQVAQEVEVNKLPQVTDTQREINIRQAEEDELRAALAANLPETVDRRFSLSQVRNINAVRQLVPEIGVDSINFETGSSVIRPEEAKELAALGTLMRERISQNPGEVFLIEGHTDAVGAAGYNLALSDRRAESVALALTEYFDVPPENMVVQGYGEYDLKIRTAEAERENRRAAVRRITALLSGN